MARFLFVTRDSGGNRLPAQRIAAELDARGHQIRWLVLPRQAIDMAAVAPAERGAITFGQIMANPAASGGTAADLAAAPADVLVVDCLLFGVLAAAQPLAVPAVCLVPTPWPHDVLWLKNSRPVRLSRVGEDLPLGRLREHLLGGLAGFRAWLKPEQRRSWPGQNGPGDRGGHAMDTPSRDQQPARTDFSGRNCWSERRIGD